MERNKLITLIHVASNNAHKCSKCQRIFYGKPCPVCESNSFTYFSREDYKDLLIKLTGKTSCKELTDDQLNKVYEFFIKAGFKPVSKKPNVIKEIESGNYGTINRIYGRGKQVLGPAYKKRIYGFVKIKFKGKTLNNLDKNELRAVIGWINRMAKSNAKGEQDANKTND